MIYNKSNLPISIRKVKKLFVTSEKVSRKGFSLEVE
jgi:hypothetical protein